MKALAFGWRTPFYGRAQIPAILMVLLLSLFLSPVFAQLPLNISGPVNVPNTGGFQAWQTINVSLGNITSGVHTFRFVMDANDFNVNYLDFKSFVTLPISLVSFEAQQTSQKTVWLTWHVENQRGNSRYELERSTDGITFNTIAIVFPDFEENASYHYNDQSSVGDKIFYRIRIVEPGQSTYSKIAALTKRSSVAPARLYPQPAIRIVTIELNNIQLLNTVATLVDNQGRVLRQIKLTQQRQAIDITSLKTGTYYVRVADGDALKLVKVD